MEGFYLYRSLLALYFLWINIIWIKQQQHTHNVESKISVWCSADLPSVSNTQVWGDWTIFHVTQKCSSALLCSLSLLRVIPTLTGKRGPVNSSPSTLNVTSIHMDWTKILSLRMHLFCFSYQLCVYYDFWRKLAWIYNESVFVISFSSVSCLAKWTVCKSACLLSVCYTLHTLLAWQILNCCFVLL